MRFPHFLRQPLLRKHAFILRNDFTSFVGSVFQQVNPGTTFLPNWHIDAIAEYLKACQRGEITRLIINMPPRALKSLTISVAWPAWLLGHAPETRIIAASYATSLAVKHSLDCRLVMASRWYRRLFPKTLLSKDQNEKHKFMTTARGFRFATSVEGSVTGEGGNWLIVDDPHNPLQAESDAERTRANQWFDHTFATRLDDKQKGVIIVVMQRLHADDLTAHLQKKGGWTQLCLPAIAPVQESFSIGNRIFTREAGAALHPERESLALLERAQQEMGSAAFSAQYQQNPLPKEGHLIRASWLKRYHALPEEKIRIVQSWDTGIKPGATNDPSACATFMEADGHYLANMQVLRLEYPDLKRAVIASAEQFKPHAILIEDKASGQSLIQDLRRETTLPIIAIHPVRDKVSRLAAVSAMIEAGRLLLPERARWLAEFETELLGFPNVAHDDQVDAVSQYLNWARARGTDAMRIRKL